MNMTKKMQQDFHAWLLERKRQYSTQRRVYLAAYVADDDDRFLDRLISNGAKLSAFNEVLSWITNQTKEHQ